MQLCYVDESGTAETLTRADTKQQPVIVIAGVMLPEARLTAITHAWLKIKGDFYPSARRSGHGWLDAILHDIKGTTLRRGFQPRGTTRQRKHSLGIIDQTIKLLERYDAKLLGRIYVKELGAENHDMRMHSSSLQFICGAFDAALPADERGMVVVDSQTYRHNHQLAHSVFTQRFAKTPKHEGLVDMPVFGHSDNHAGLQIADLLCSAVLAPVACAVYAARYGSWNTHCTSGLLDIREHFGARLERLTFTWRDPHRGNRPGTSLVVSDPLGKRPSRLMWSPASAPARSIRSRSMTIPADRRPPH